jgi:cytoskeletal protein CcmA (bactofilin family)/DNA-directed RNA polymerase subunit RPC12/RpoP
MPATMQDKVLVACPQCGHQQPEPRAAISTVCKKCRQHIQIQAADKPAVRAAPKRRPVEKEIEHRKVTCFECGTELEVALNAESTMCKRCSRHMDLRDYRITSAVSKNFKTRGAFVIEQKGYVFNTDAVVGDAVLKGRLLGKLQAERLTIYTGAEIKGTFKAGTLVIPAENVFRWKETLKLESAEIAGELVADVKAEGTIILKSSARLFGDVEAKSLVVEDGAIAVGQMRIGNKGRSETNGKAP